jgi:hypothetical protein
VPGLGPPGPDGGVEPAAVDRRAVGRGSALSLALGAGVLLTAALALLAWSAARWSAATFLAGVAFAVGLGLLVASGARVRRGLGLALAGTLLGLLGLLLGSAYVLWGTTIDAVVEAGIGAIKSEEGTQPTLVGIDPRLVRATGQAAGVDSAGNAVIFGPTQAVDGDLATAWRVPASESAASLAAGWTSETDVSRVVLWSASAETVRVTIAFDDGSVAEGELGPDEPLAVDVAARSSTVTVGLQRMVDGPAPDSIGIAEMQVWAVAA